MNAVNITLQIDNFVKVNQLRPADAIVVKKEFFGILDHYVIYLGYDNVNHKHVFIANYLKGIQILKLGELAMFLAKYLPVRINRFIGSEQQRTEAVQRALKRKDENSYHLILHNCEHFKNYVHHGVESSDQIKNWGNGLIAAGAATGLAGAAAKKDGAVVAGVLMAGVGLILRSLEE